jgi:SAM-dependent methyltransferase
VTPEGIACPICRRQTVELGIKRGSRIDQTFHLRRCMACDFSFVSNPCTDYTAIYDEQYYLGRGSDPMVDYASEYDHPATTVRRNDWEGIEEVVTSLHPARGRWLDYGCGNGGLVRNVAANGRWTVFGHDTGAWASRARSDGLPVLTEDELRAARNTFDVITVIEVIEHIPDPVGFLSHLRELARPGALLFMTTLNASVAPKNFLSWHYVIPEIHVSFFTPKALAIALEKSGFRPSYPGFVPGWENMIRFKVLKNLGVRRNSGWHSILPWSMLARLVDAKHQVTQLPVGIAI